LDGPEAEPEIDPITGLPIEPEIDPETGLLIERDTDDTDEHEALNAVHHRPLSQERRPALASSRVGC
jgi:hypothetical protein